MPVGRVVYTPVLSPGGGFKSDLTIMRLGDDSFRIVTGGAHGMADRKWFSDLLPRDGSASLVDVTTAWTTIGLWGPRARDILASVTRDDVSNEGFPFGRCRELEIGSQLVLASRISYVGENGWEIYTNMEHGLRLWDTVAEAGKEFEIIPVGIGVYAVTGRIEKGYRLMGAELESEYNPVEAGLARPKVKSADFMGKEAYMKARDEKPAAIMCTLSMDSQQCAAGYDRFPTGGNEPILTMDGERILDAKGRVSRVTTAGAGPSVGKFLLLAYLPPEHAVEGAKLQVMYMNELYPVTVERVDATPLFDPTDARMKS